MKPSISPKRHLLHSVILFFLVFSFSFYFYTSFQTANAQQQKSLIKEYEAITPDAIDTIPQQLIPDRLPAGPQTALPSLEKFNVPPDAAPVTIALKAGDLINSLSNARTNLAVNPSIRAGSLTEAIADKAEDVTKDVGQMYAEVGEIFNEVNAMKQQVKQNYANFNGSKQSAQEGRKLNAASEDMSRRTEFLKNNVEAMADRIELNNGLMEGMKDRLSEMEANGQESKIYYDRLDKQVDDVSGRFDGMVKKLKAVNLDAPNAIGEVKQYLASFSKHINSQKAYTNKEIQYVKDIRGYVQKHENYVNKANTDMKKAAASLASLKEYFDKAKVDLEDEQTTDGGIAPEGVKDIEQDICSQETDAPPGGPLAKEKKGKPLESLQHCSKHCRTVCRQKKNVGNTHCYECPSGSGDTCNDVGGLPADHAWCKPGGICYDDPLMYCSMYGAVGPNKMPLQCANCLERPDECSVKVAPNTSTYTSCMTNCKDGECTYKGKYGVAEWDGKPEFMHCYECKHPPGPPTCEDLGWGTTKEAMCMKDCKDGKCKKLNFSVGADGKVHVKGDQDMPLPKGNSPGPGGPVDGPMGGDNAGGATPSGGDTREKAGTGTDVPPANPPTDGPNAGTDGGGGTIAGNGPQTGSKPLVDSGNTDSGRTEPQKPPQDPGGNAPQAPQAPGSQERPKPPEEPKAPEPPTNPDIDFYKKWLKEIEDRIKSRDDIINNKKEGESVQTMAREQKENLEKTRDDLKKRIEDLEKAEQAKRDAAEAEKKRQAEWERTRPRTPDYAEEAKRRGQIWKMNQLRNAIERLKSKAQEAKDALEARRARLQRIADEIRRLKEKGDTLTKEEKQRLNELQGMQSELTKKYMEAERNFNQELDQLKSEYRKALWQVDENARRTADLERMKEFSDLNTDLKTREQARAIRNQTFDNMANSLEGALKDAEARGDSTAADKFRRQIENLKRQQTEWNTTMERQEENIKNQMYEIGQRNFSEGAGPWRVEELGEKITKYTNDLQERLNNPNLTTEQKAQIQNAIDGLKREQQNLTNPQLSSDTKQRITDSATRVAAASMDRDADKGYLQLAGESLVEEVVETATNPFVAAEKVIAFNVGMVKGVGKAVGGLAELGWGATKLVGQSIAVDLGFEDGGILGTSALDTMNAVLTTVADNANPEGLLKAVIAAGGALDAKMKELEKSTNINWATAEFGGEIVGENVLGPEAIGLGLGAAAAKAKTLIRGGEEVAEVANAVNKGTKALEASETALANAGKAGGELEAAATTGVKAGEDALAAGGKTAKFDGVLDVADNTPTVKGGLMDGVHDTTVRGGLMDDASRAHGPGPIDNTPTVKGGLMDDAGKAHGPGVPDEAPTVKGGLTQEAPRAPPADPVLPPEPTKPLTVNNQPHAGIGEFQEIKGTGANGENLNIQTGKQLGKGSTSTAFVDAADPNKVVRVTDLGITDSPYAAKLDQAGRTAVESIQRPGGPIKIVEKYESHVITDPTGKTPGKLVESVERAKMGSADKFLEAQGGKMTQGQAEAFDAAMKELNKNGYAWMDNHTGNYGFQKLPGEDKWQVVVIDAGGIVPAKGATAAERAENALTLQRKVNIPTDEYKMGHKMVENFTDDFMKKGIADDARRAIIDEVGSKIDTAKLGIPSQPVTPAGLKSQFPGQGDAVYDFLKANNALDAHGQLGDISKAVSDGIWEKFPDQAEDIMKALRSSRGASKIGFYPGGTMNFPEVQALTLQ